MNFRKPLKYAIKIKLQCKKEKSVSTGSEMGFEDG